MPRELNAWEKHQREVAAQRPTDAEIIEAMERAIFGDVECLNDATRVRTRAAAKDALAAYRKITEQ